MAETKDTVKGLIRFSDDTSYYIRRDPFADTFSIILANEREYHDNTGRVLYQAIKTTEIKQINTLSVSNTGSIDRVLLGKSGGQALLSHSLERGLMSQAGGRLDAAKEGRLSELPDIKPGSFFQLTLRTAEETRADLLSPADRSPIRVVTPGSRATKIGGNQVLKYPLDMDTRFQDCLQIKVFGYLPGGIPGINEGTDQSRSARRLEQVKEIIQIPIPNAIADSNAVTWGAESITSSSGQVAGAVVNSLFGEGDDGNVQNAFKTATQLIGETGRVTMDALADPFIRRRKIANIIASGAAAFGVNIDVNQVITRKAGVIENPNLELLFTGPSLRAFQFAVRFSPRNKDESKRVRTIIRVLKERSAVKKGVTIASGLVSANSSNLLLGTPDVFELRYLKAGTQSEIKGLHKFKTCALTNISVDYTGGEGRFSAYSLDSQPVTTVVTMSFSELVPLYDEDYFEEFSADDDVGF